VYRALLGIAVLMMLGSAGAASAASPVATRAQQKDADVPAYTLSLSADGHAVVLSGGVRFGLARDLQSLLDATPGIATLILTSPGGRLSEAESVAHLIRARGLNTYVPQYCYSACTRIFVAGEQRTLAIAAKLGFHGAALTAPVPALAARFVLWGVNETEVADYAADGVDRAFMRRAMAVTPPGLWRPTAKELLAAHVITAAPVTRQFVLPPPVPVPPAPPEPVAPDAT